MKKLKKDLPIQAVFMQKLKEMLPPHVGLAEEISDVLGIGIDSAYRRIRCETELTLDEVFKLTKRYALSTDAIFSNMSDTVTFTYTKLTDDADNFEKYLSRIYHHLKNINTFKEKKLFYVAEEIPIFYSFFGKKLIEFKLFYWQRSVLNVPFYQGKKFEFGLVPEKIVKLASECYEEYKRVPSLEIWTEETIFTATRQIEFYLQSGVFTSKSQALEVMEDVKAMVDHLEQCAERGNKEISDTEENFQLYCSDVVLGTNCIYVKSGDANYAYISFNTFNSLTTNNSEFCDETEHWIKNLVKKSTLISGVAEKQRYQFFSKLRRNLDESIKRINSY